jgi:alpha-L-fucosidase
VQELLKIYYNSVGRNSLLLLNVPPDRRGLIPAEDSLRLVEFRTALDSVFARDLAKKAIKLCVSNFRGIGLYKNSYDAANLIGEQFKPTVKATNSWDITEDCDVVIWNTSGCHIYKIEVTSGAAGIQAVKAAKAGNGYIYNLAGQRVDANYKGVVIKNGQKMIQK